MYSKPSTAAPLNPGGPLAMPPMQEAQPSPVQGVTFIFAMLLVFMRFSMIHQVQAQLMGVNLYLLYVIGIPAMIGVLVTGGIPRTLRSRTGMYWLLFGVWLLAAVPFSSWKGGSAPIVITFWRTDLIMLFVVGGTALTWRDCRRLMTAIALAAIASLAMGELFSRIDNNQRMQLNFGTVANSNDYAGHLIIVLPFLLWVILSGKPLVYRLISIGMIAYGMYAILATGSRGALIAIVVGLLFSFFASTGQQRIVITVFGMVALLLGALLLPHRTWQRLTSFSENGASSEEALESSHAREYLLKTSVLYTFEHPLFGVGAGQFCDIEGVESRKRGELGMWHDTHNSYTQIASENGLPAFFLFVAGIGSSILLLYRTYKASKGRPEFREIAATSFCLLLAMISFCVAIAFLNFGYFFYLPAMGGLAICISRAAAAEFRKAPAPVPANQPLPYVWQRRPISPKPAIPSQAKAPIRAGYR